MKIALLVSGVYKNATQPLFNFLNFLRNQKDIESVDVYMHLWWDKSYVGKRYRTNFCHIVEDDPTNDINRLIKPVKLVLEPQFKPNTSDLPRICEGGGDGEQRELAYFASLSQFESCKRCLALVENPSTYDCIWRHRADLFIEGNSYTFNITKEMLKSSKVWIADGQFFTGYPYGDWSFLGNPEAMVSLISEWDTLFKINCISRNTFSHIHIYLPAIIRYLGYEPIRWFIPLNITRHSKLQDGHYLWDPNTKDLSLKPYFYDLVDKSRF